MESTLPPIDRLEANRLCHAMAAELWLPGSPPGQNGHPALSQCARHIFGVKSFSELSTEQMVGLWRFMDENRRLPRRGEISA